MDNKLIQIRMKKGLSRKELAEKSGISYETIRSIEAGQTKYPSVNSLAKLANALDCSIPDIDSTLSKLTLLRGEKELSKSELAELSGVSYQTIINIESRKEPQWSTIEKLSEALKCNPFQIYEGSFRKEKSCPVCGKRFIVTPSTERIDCCSIKCRDIHCDKTKAIKKAKDAWKNYDYMDSNKQEYHRAKFWKIQSPDGTVYEFRNLMLWLREHEDLYEGTPKNAFTGIAKMKLTMQGKTSVSSFQWKGWRLLEYGD